MSHGSKLQSSKTEDFQTDSFIFSIYGAFDTLRDILIVKF